MKYFITHTTSKFTRNTTMVEFGEFSQKVHLLVDPKTNKKIKMGVSSCVQELVNLILKENAVFYKKQGQTGKNGFIFGAGNSKFPGIDTAYLSDDVSLNPFKIAGLSLVNIYAGKIANQLGWNNFISTDSTACISGTKALIDAQLYMAKNKLDKVLVLSAEDSVAPEMLYFFGKLNASITRSEEEATGKKPSAFDDENGGFHIGQGVNVTIIESEESIKQTGNTPLCEIVSSAICGEELSDPLSQRPDGAGYAEVITSLLGEAQLTPSDISFVKTHGTGTLSNNACEGKALIDAFGSQLIATSYKQQIGHTMGASSMVELDLALQDCKRGMLTGIANRTKQDDVFISTDTPITADNIMLLSAGMGNVYAGIIVKNMQ